MTSALRVIGGHRRLDIGFGILDDSDRPAAAGGSTWAAQRLQSSREVRPARRKRQGAGRLPVRTDACPGPRAAIHAACRGERHMQDAIETRATVLIVDDEAINRRILGRALEHEHLLEFAENGEAALKIARELHPDLILLDVMMPDVDGFEVCTRLREDPAIAHIPVIFVTSLDDHINEEQGLRAGAVDYISKPIEPLIVRARVKLHIDLRRYTDFLERLLKRRTESLEEAQEEARQILALAGRGSSLDG